MPFGFILPADVFLYASKSMLKLRYREQYFELDAESDYGVFQHLPEDIVNIARTWHSEEQEFTLHTSGSTGKPSKIRFSRVQLTESARMTAKAFGLRQGDTALCCLSTQHVAGFMMVIRAMVLGLELIYTKPSRNPLKDIFVQSKIDFAAFVPLQIQTILKESPALMALINNMKSIIIGGGPVSPRLEVDIDQIKAPVYHTYGMTETLTHVAVRRLNGEKKEKVFRPLKGVQLSLDERGCLVIKSPAINNMIITNDLAVIHADNSFEIIGRIDHVINSAGYKIHAEQLEKRIFPVMDKYFPDRAYFISGVMDDLLGQKAILLIEDAKAANEKMEKFRNALRGILAKYEYPREIVFLDNFARSTLLKIDKNKTLLNLPGNNE